MTSLLFNKTLRQAFKTFDKSNTASLSANLKILYQLTEQLTYRDINLNPDVFINANTPDKAPCTYIHVFESAEVSMSVFILKANYTMPLHDHPMMNGVLKGIFGKLLIKSYSAIPRESTSTSSLTSHKNELIYDKYVTEIDVTEEEPKLVTPSSECAVLTPTERNFHEITAVGDVAAFFDILSPPYSADIPVYGRRKCHFYDRIKIDDQLTVLSRMIPDPLDYYCDTVEAPEAVAESQNTYLEMYGLKHSTGGSAPTN